MSAVTKALSDYQNVNVINWAKRLIARHATGARVSQEMLKQARQVLASRKC